MRLSRSSIKNCFFAKKGSFELAYDTRACVLSIVDRWMRNRKRHDTLPWKWCKEKFLNIWDDERIHRILLYCHWMDYYENSLLRIVHASVWMIISLQHLPSFSDVVKSINYGVFCVPLHKGLRKGSVDKFWLWQLEIHC